jgi:hypothetical protein
VNALVGDGDDAGRLHDAEIRVVHRREHRIRKTATADDRVKMLRRRTIIRERCPRSTINRFEVEFESEELRQNCIASVGHERV